MNDTDSTVNKSLQQINQLQQRAIQFAESGMVEEALEAAMICIGLQEEVAPNDLLLRAKLTQNASRILLYAGELDYSEKIAREGLDLLQTAEGVTNDDRAHAFLNMSSILYTKKELDSAALILQDALAIWSKETGRDAEVAECYNNLGRLREEQGRAEEAIELHQQAIDIKRNIFGDHEQTAFSIMNKGLALMLSKQFLEAKVTLEEAIACYRRVGQYDSEMVKACEQNLKICLEHI